MHLWAPGRRCTIANASSAEEVSGIAAFRSEGLQIGSAALLPGRLAKQHDMTAQASDMHCNQPGCGSIGCHMHAPHPTLMGFACAEDFHAVACCCCVVCCPLTLPVRDCAAAAAAPSCQADRTLRCWSSPGPTAKRPGTFCAGHMLPWAGGLCGCRRPCSCSQARQSWQEMEGQG